MLFRRFNEHRLPRYQPPQPGDNFPAAPRDQQEGYRQESVDGILILPLTPTRARQMAPQTTDVSRHMRHMSRDITMVDLRGLEPLTPCMPCRCATSCATGPDGLADAQNPRNPALRRHSGGGDSQHRRQTFDASGPPSMTLEVLELSSK